MSGIGFGIGIDMDLSGFITHLVTIAKGKDKTIQYKATCMKDDDDEDSPTTLYKIVNGEKDYDNHIEISDDESVTICIDGEYYFASIIDIDINGGDLTIECEDDFTDEQIHIQCDLLVGSDECNYEDIFKFSTFDLDGNELDDDDEDDDDDWDDEDDDDEDEDWDDEDDDEEDEDWDDDDEEEDEDWDEDDEEEDSVLAIPLDSRAPYKVKIIFKDDHIERYYASKEYGSNYDEFTLYLSKSECIDKTNFIKINYDEEMVYINLGTTYITAELLNVTSHNLDDYIICWGGDFYRSISIDSKYRH